MIIDKLIEESVRPFEALLTKQRCMVFLFSIIFISPEFPALISAILNNVSVSEFAKLFSEVLISPSLYSFVVLAVTSFYFSPKLNHLISIYFNAFVLRRHDLSIKRLTELFEQDDEFFFERYSEVDGAWKSEKEDAEGSIKARSVFCEILFSLFILVFLSCFVFFEVDCVSVLFLFFVGVFYCFDASQKNVADYLSGVAPYKIALARFEQVNVRK